ncbi:MAG TPA: helix-turn-helix domain-containing protein, partial [Oculatellaceae cyanobacterium]
YATSTVSFQNTLGEQQVIPLTTKEFQLLEYFMKHPNQILPRDRIRNQLWDMNADPISNVVAAQVRLLRRKLAEIGCDRLIQTVPNMGYRLNLTDESK